MAVNRYRQAFYSPDTNYTPDVTQEFIPDLSGLEQVMGSLQQQLDATSQYDLPKYLRQSPTDKAAFDKYKADIESYRQGAIDAFTSGNFNAGHSKLRGFGEYIRKSKMPEGSFYELERGVSEYNNALKQITDTYLDPKSDVYNPYIYAFAKKKLDEGIPNFRDQFGQSRIGISGPTLDRYIPQDQVIKQMNEVLDNIEADQVIRGNRVPKQLQGLTFKQILERGETEFIDFNKVASVLANNTSPEIIKSYNLLGEAMNMGPGQGNAFRPDGKGFDTSTMLGRTLQGLADSKTFTKQKDNYNIITDDYSMEAYKSRLRNAEKNYEYNLGNETLRTQVYSNNTGMPKLNFDVDKDGTLIKNEISAAALTELQSSPSGLIDPDMIKTTKIGNIKDYLQTSEGRAANPAFTDIYDKFRSEINNMPPKQAYEFLAEKYNEKKEALSVVDAKVEVYGPKMQEARQKTLIGDQPGAGLGNINKKRIIVMENNGADPQVFTLEQFLDEYDITTEDFKKNARVLGSIYSDNNLVASGEEATWSDPKSGDVINFIASDLSLEDLQYKTPDFTLYGPAHKADIKESGFTNTGIPELDAAYGRIKSKANDVYLSDIYAEQAANFNITESERKEAIKELEKIQKNPKLNKFSHREVQLYDENGVNLTANKGLHLEDILQIKQQLSERLRNTDIKQQSPRTTNSRSLTIENTYY